MSKGIVTKTFKASFSPTGVRNVAEIQELFQDTTKWIEADAAETGYVISWDTATVDSETEEFEDTTISGGGDFLQVWTHVNIRVTGYKEVEVDDREEPDLSD